MKKIFNPAGFESWLKRELGSNYKEDVFKNARMVSYYSKAQLEAVLGVNQPEPDEAPEGKLFTGVGTAKFFEAQAEANAGYQARASHGKRSFRARCLFPEHHQAIVTSHKLSPEDVFAFDTTHPEHGRCDFKYHGKKGIHLSKYIKQQIELGVIETIVAWKFEKFSNDLIEENEKVQYRILEYIDAKEVLDNLNSDGRFLLS